MTTRLFLVDDHAVIRSGLKMLLENEQDMEIVGEAENARDAIQDAILLKPNVILMDIGLPDMSGIEAELKDKLAKFLTPQLPAIDNGDPSVTTR